MKILWMGTGVMGGPMAGHLMAAGHELTVFSRTRAKAAELEASGARWAERPADVASEMDLVCAMVGFPRDVEEVLLGSDGVVEHMQAGAMLIDFTTSSPELARRIADTATLRGVQTLDAPVSGGDVGARNAALSIMVGGDRATFDRCLPVLKVVGKTIVYQGEAGAGQHTKMVNQILAASGMIGVCEALLYAQQAGLDPQTVLESVGSGAATSWALMNLGPRILDGNFEPGFFVEHFVKDMGIALDECRRMNLDLPGLQLAHQLYEKVVEQGMGRQGTQALFLALERMNEE